MPANPTLRRRLKTDKTRQYMLAATVVIVSVSTAIFLDAVGKPDLEESQWNLTQKSDKEISTLKWELSRGFSEVGEKLEKRENKFANLTSELSRVFSEVGEGIEKEKEKQQF